MSCQTIEEAYAVRCTAPASAESEARIEQLLAVGVGDDPRESLSELAKLGARLIIRRAVEDEFDAWLGRARYERRPEYQRGLQNYGRAAQRVSGNPPLAHGESGSLNDAR